MKLLPSKSNFIEKQNNIDLLRALAVSAVFIHHAQHTFGGNFPFFGEYGGQFGPQLFFLISGYLIIASWQKYTWKEYVLHRFFRIIPAYLFFFLGIGWFENVITIDRIFSQFYYFLANLFLIQQLIPNALIAFDVLHVTWTLTVEVIWYASAPLFSFMLMRYPRGTVFIVTLAATAWSWLSSTGYLNALYPSLQNNPVHIYLFISNNFLSQVCFFVFGAWVYQHKRKLSTVNPLTVILLGLGVFLLRSYFFIFNPIFITGIGLMFFMIAAINTPSVKNYFIMLLSETSYSIYLCHFPILLFIHNQLGFNGLIGLLISLVSTLAVSFLTYTYIEKPGMRLGRQLANRWHQRPASPMHGVVE